MLFPVILDYFVFRSLEALLEHKFTLFFLEMTVDEAENLLQYCTAATVDNKQRLMENSLLTMATD
jgi:hypothetical protein